MAGKKQGDRHWSGLWNTHEANPYILPLPQSLCQQLKPGRGDGDNPGDSEGA